MMSVVKRTILLLVICIVSIGADQFSKSVAKAELMGKGRISFLGDIVRLQYIENRGAFLSLGDGLGNTVGWILLVVLPIIALACAVVYIYLSKKITVSSLVGLSLIIGGGAGNLIDRIAYNRSVIDFLNFGIGNGPFRTGIMNVADLVLVAGFIVLIFSGPKKEKAAEPKKPE